ncbi:MAG TPA: hemolysin family protein [Gemmatimonadaceae bacterium]|nr:hemolysin family protein [Gemmatimonadaceae bacterium]
MTYLAWTSALMGGVLAVVTGAAAGALASPDGRREPGAVEAHRALGIVRVAAYLALGAGLARGMARAVSAPGIVQAAAVAVLIAAVLVLDAAARERASARGGEPSAPTRGFARGASVLLRPLVTLGTTIERALYRVLPPRTDLDAEREATADELRAVLAPRHEAAASEATQLHRAFALATTRVDEIMMPRVDIIGVEVETPWSEVLDRVRSSEHARLPVYRETLDDVVGILYAKDMLAWSVQGDEPPGGWVTLVRPALFIPASKTIDRQLREFRKSGSHMAIVVDEFGGTAGLVTIEDVLEEIVGEIRDERDVEQPDVEREGNDRFWVSGRVPLGDLSDLLGTSMEREDVSTVGGLAYEEFGRVPRPGDSKTIGEFRVVVERVRRRRVERVYFERLPQHSAAAQEAE